MKPKQRRTGGEQYRRKRVLGHQTAASQAGRQISSDKSSDLHENQGPECAFCWHIGSAWYQSGPFRSKTLFEQQDPLADQALQQLLISYDLPAAGIQPGTHGLVGVDKYL